MSMFNNQPMQSDNQQIDNLVKELTLAREQSFLGDYEASLAQFKMIMTKV